MRKPRIVTLAEFRRLTKGRPGSDNLALLIAGLGAAIGTVHLEPDGTIVLEAVPEPVDDVERFGRLEET